MTPIPLFDSLRAAFHESGHCNVALFIDPLLVSKVRIYWRGGLWFGDSQIATSKMGRVQLTAIALAGLFAEARASAEAKAKMAKSLDENRYLAADKRLINEVDRIVGIALENRVRSIDSRIPIESVPGELIDEVASLSLEDIQYIPDSVLDKPKTLQEAVDLALKVINDNGEWASVRRIADVIVKREPEWVDDLVALRAGSSSA